MVSGQDLDDQARARHDDRCPPITACCAGRCRHRRGRQPRWPHFVRVGAEFFKYWKLELSTVEFLTHSCALYRDETYNQRPAFEVVQRMQACISSSLSCQCVPLPGPYPTRARNDPCAWDANFRHLYRTHAALPEFDDSLREHDLSVSVPVVWAWRVATSFCAACGGARGHIYAQS